MRFFGWILLLLLTSSPLVAQTLAPPTERIISIDCVNRPVEQVLDEMAAQAKFYWSYDARLVDPKQVVTLHEKQITVRRAIDLIFKNKIACRSKGNHCILVAAPEPLAADVSSPPRKKNYTIGGYITDAKSGNRILYATVYDSISLHSALSDEWGYYQLELDASKKPMVIKASRIGYADTIFQIIPDANQTVDLRMRALPPAQEFPRTAIAHLPNDSAHNDSLTTAFTNVPESRTKRGLERFPWVDSLVGFQQVMRARNINGSLQNKAQVSLLPFVSTNGRLCGSVTNQFSLNIIAGYAGGVDGVEVGGALNVVRKDVHGAQISGAVNLTGGDVRGVQAAGFFNLDAGNVRGVQLSGGANVVLDTLFGVQLAGGSNFVAGGIYGVQVAGGSNIVLHDMDGIQLASGANITLGQVNKVQMAGWANYAGSVRGIQVAGFGNISREVMRGVQVAGVCNIAKYVRGVQVAGVLNYTRDSTSGTQIGLFNYSRHVCKGHAFGLFSFVGNGIHQIEIATTEKLMTSVSFRTGLPEFYNIITIAQGKITGEDHVWAAGYGIGHRFALPNQLAIDLEGVYQHVNQKKWSDYTNSLFNVYVGLDWVPLKFVSISCGPTFNYFISGSHTDYFAPWHPKPLYESTSNTDIRHQAWIGAKFAIRLL